MDLVTFAERGRRLLWAQTCSVQRSVGTPAGYAAPTDQHLFLRCSRVYEIGIEEEEKGFLTTTSRALKIYIEIPDSGDIKEHDRVVVNDENYIVIKANRVPHENPSFYEAIVDYRRGQ